MINENTPHAFSVINTSWFSVVGCYESLSIHIDRRID